MKTTKLIILAASLFIFSSAFATNNYSSKDVHPRHDAAFLVKRSLSLISKNYPVEENTMNAFYKEEVLKNNSFVSINEAVLSVKKESYLRTKKDRVAIKDIRGYNNLTGQDSLSVKLQGGPLSALDLDIVKNPFLGCEKCDIEKFYTFSYDKSAFLNDKEFYVVNFEPLYSKSDILFRGTIYIEKNSLAIGRIEYRMDVHRDAWSYKQFVKKTPDNKEMKMTSAEYIVNYKEHEDKWYFNYSSSDINLQITDLSSRVYDSYNIKSQIAVTNLTADYTPFESQKIINSTDVIADIAKDYNPGSKWEKYNQIMAMASGR